MKGVVKIADFGFAKNLTFEVISSCKGSLYYQAPEVLDKKNYYEPKCDIYSLGIVVLELGLGKRIFKIIEGWKPPGALEEFPS
jgi:serine/threonine protein kinase